MAVKTFKARVRIKNGASSIEQEVTVQADSAYKARFMLEAQYGKNSVLSGDPQEVR